MSYEKNTHPKAGSVASDLIQKKWIKFEDSPTGRRTRLLSLKSRGKTIYNQATDRQILWINEICEDLQAEEIESARNLLTKLCKRCLELDSPAPEFEED